MVSRKVIKADSTSLSRSPNGFINDQNLSSSSTGLFAYLIHLSKTDSNFDWSYDNVVDYYLEHHSDRKIDTVNSLKELGKNGYLRIINRDIKPEIELDGYKHLEWIE